MHDIAPNLSTVTGTEIAARLMGVAGGLAALSRMPACNVQVLGAKRRTLAGMSATAAAPHQGFVYGAALVQGAPPAFRGKAAKLVAAKCTLMARMDAYGQDPAGARFFEGGRLFFWGGGRRGGEKGAERPGAAAAAGYPALPRPAHNPSLMPP